MARDLSVLLSEIVRLETEPWDAVDNRLQHDHDLALGWFEHMRVIDHTPACRVLDIAEALSMTVGGVSKVIDRVQNAGWCRRLPNPDDGRSSIIALTPRGKRLLSAASATLADELDQRVGHSLSRCDLQNLTHALQRISEGLDIDADETRR
jgi:DNA-binding MarR family transcriptional regulator